MVILKGRQWERKIQVLETSVVTPLWGLNYQLKKISRPNSMILQLIIMPYHTPINQNQIFHWRSITIIRVKVFSNRMAVMQQHTRLQQSEQLNQPKTSRLVSFQNIQSNYPNIKTVAQISVKRGLQITTALMLLLSRITRAAPRDSCWIKEKVKLRIQFKMSRHNKVKVALCKRKDTSCR